MKGIETV